MEHTWDSLKNQRVSVSGSATVTWNLKDPSRHVVHDLTWTRLSDGRTGEGSGDTVQKPLPDGLKEGISVNGDRQWKGQKGQWDLSIDRDAMRWADPVPQAGSYELTAPNGKTATLSFKRIDADTIEADFATGPVVHVPREQGRLRQERQRQRLLKRQRRRLLRRLPRRLPRRRPADVALAARRQSGHFGAISSSRTLSWLIGVGILAAGCGPSTPEPAVPDKGGTPVAAPSGTAVASTCAEGKGECDGNAATACETDLAGSAQHCGACGNACAAGQSCSAGACRAGQSISASGANACVVISGHVVCWGDNSANLLASGGKGPRATP